MKFVCTKENIQHALQAVSGITGKSTHLPILSHVHVRAEKSGVVFSATNLETAVRVRLRAKVETEGQCSVPAKTLADFVQLLRDEQITFVFEENELGIAGGSSSTKIKGTNGEDFPVIPEVEKTHEYIFLKDILRTSLSNTMLAAAKNDIRPELSGVYFGFFTERHKGLVLAATDSYRLAEKKCAIQRGGDEQTCIVPGSAVFEMVRLIALSSGSENASDVTVWVNENQIAIQYGQIEMTSRLVDGTYPDYAQIVPDAFKTKAVIEKDVLVNSIKAASLFTTTGVNAVSFDLNASQNMLGVSSTSTQTGEHAGEIEATVDGEENSILLNHRYVLDGLGQLDGEIEFSVNSGDMPCMFRKKGDEGYVYIVMPIRQ